MIALVTGPDAFTAREAVHRLRRQHDPESIDSSTIDGRLAAEEELVAAVSTPGFFGAGRVVVIEDAMARWTKRDAHDDGTEADNRRGIGIDWARLFASVLPTNMAIFVDRSLPAVPAAVRKALPAGATTVIGDPPRGAELVRWMTNRAANAGSSISDSHARLLAETLFPSNWTARPSNPAYDHPPALDQIANEIDKLALAARPGPIERNHLSDLVPQGNVDRLFPLIDAAVTGNLRAAVNELATLQGSDEHARASAQIYQQIELIAALDAAGERPDPVAVGRALGLANPNRMIGVAKSLQRLRGPIRQRLLAALEVERQQKVGVLRQPETVLQALVDTSAAEPSERQRGGT